MIEDQLGRCVASWYPGATGVTGVAKLSGGASQETWTFDIVHPNGTVGAILRRAPPGFGASPGRAAGLDAEAVLMQLAHDDGLPSPRSHEFPQRHRCEDGGKGSQTDPGLVGEQDVCQDQPLVFGP